MKFTLADVHKLQFPLTLNGTTYTKRQGRFSRLVGGLYTIVFSSPHGLNIEMSVQEHDDWGRATIWLDVEGQPIHAEFGTSFFRSSTASIPDARLAALVEAAISDLEAEERRLDPTGRHAASKTHLEQLAASKAARKASLSQTQRSMDGL